jgi:hypothetical protein
MSMRTRFSGALALAVAGVLAMSCGGFIDPSKNQVETFSGTVAKGSYSAGFAFTVARTGEFTVKITALAPNSSAVLGVLYAQALSDGSCSSSPQPYGYPNNFVLLNAPALSGQIFSGRYCVYVYDPTAALTATATFTLTVSHP